jgi:hypothetical protein
MNQQSDCMMFRTTPGGYVVKPPASIWTLVEMWQQQLVGLLKLGTWTFEWLTNSYIPIQ